MSAMQEPLLKTIRLDHSGDSDSYAFSLPSVRHLRELKLTKPVTFFTGPSGVSSLASAARMEAPVSPRIQE